jgi:hypothetical protein
LIDLKLDETAFLRNTGEFHRETALFYVERFLESIMVHDHSYSYFITPGLHQTISLIKKNYIKFILILKGAFRSYNDLVDTKVSKFVISNYQKAVKFTYNILKENANTYRIVEVDNQHKNNQEKRFKLPEVAFCGTLEQELLKNFYYAYFYSRKLRKSYYR